MTEKERIIKTLVSERDLLEEKIRNLDADRVILETDVEKTNRCIKYMGLTITDPAVVLRKPKEGDEVLLPGSTDTWVDKANGYDPKDPIFGFRWCRKKKPKGRFVEYPVIERDGRFELILQHVKQRGGATRMARPYPCIRQ